MWMNRAWYAVMIGLLAFAFLVLRFADKIDNF